MLLITNFLQLGVVAGINRTLAVRQHAVSCRHPAATLPRPCHGTEKSLSERHILGMAGERQGNGMGTAWYVWIKHGRTVWIKWEKTQSKALAERHGRGTAGERHGNSKGKAWYVWIRLYSADVYKQSSAVPLPSLRIFLACKKGETYLQATPLHHCIM
jgi:hypothetical protein